MKIVLESIRSPEIREGEKVAEKKLCDLALLQKAKARLLGVLGIDIRHINIQVKEASLR